ncbi:FmdE, Molybdenum formylmethanofuran dehydrogenase operon [uncultured archaeon]|nr:FmdE, Molybdenum formylmethanofuran dehydrogenase operon [uncultured archaeon]
MDDELKKAVEFHGHLCPGIVIGYRVSKYVREHYPRSEDEELVCIVENNSCSVDAVQALLGCTFGKGNLIYKDYGKQTFTFYSRGDGKAIRLYFKADLSKRMDKLRGRYFQGKITGEEKKEFEALRDQIMQHMIDAPDNEILDVREVDLPEPNKARIFPSLKCQECGEGFMEICGRTIKGKVVCKECYEKML